VRFADLLAPFRKVYVSNEIGARKPEAAAFAAVIADMGIPPQRILFFDDSGANVAGAKACGLNAVQVTGTEDIERALSGVVPGF
jgi:glucose-1-phosphatase